MQIRNDYHPRQGQAYNQSHTHHITECIHEETGKKKQGPVVGEMPGYKKGDAAKAAVEYVASFSVEEMSVNAKKTKTGGLKQFWDSLGDDGQANSTIDMKQMVINGIHGVAAGMQAFWDRRIVKPAVALKEKAKTIPSRAVGGFGKGKEAFHALLSGGMTFGKNRSKERKPKEQEEIPVNQPKNHHLTDSYNRSGNYCQLHENLTYQKPKAKAEITQTAKDK